MLAVFVRLIRHVVLPRVADAGAWICATHLCEHQLTKPVVSTAIADAGERGQDEQRDGGGGVSDQEEAGGRQGGRRRAGGGAARSNGISRPISSSKGSSRSGTGKQLSPVQSRRRSSRQQRHKQASYQQQRHQVCCADGRQVRGNAVAGRLRRTAVAGDCRHGHTAGSEAVLDDRSIGKVRSAIEAGACSHGAATQASAGRPQRALNGRGCMAQCGGMTSTTVFRSSVNSCSGF